MLSEALSDSLQRLRRVLRRAAGSYALIRVVTDDASRGAVIDALRAGGEGVGPLRMLPVGAEGAAALESVLREGGLRLHGLVVPDADALLTFDGGRVVAGLNLARDRLDAIVAGPLVLVLSPGADGALAAQAPDLRDATLSVVRVEAPAVASLSGPEAAISPEVASAEFARIVAANLPDADAVDALLQLGWQLRISHLEGDGSPQLPLLHQIAEEAQTRALRCGYVRGQANALTLLAVSDRQNREALLRQAIGMFDQLGLEVDLDRARARGQLAHTLLLNNSLNDGLTLFREKVLPEVDRSGRIMEQLGARDTLLRLLDGNGRYREAVALARDELAPLARVAERPDLELHYLSMAASNEVRAGNDSEGIAQILDEVIPRARRLNRPDKLAFAYTTLVRAYGHRAGPGDRERSLLYADLARRLYLQMSDSKAAAGMQAVLRAHDARAPRNRAERRRDRTQRRRG